MHLLTPSRSEPLLRRNIIAFTFTEKAAAELKERIVTRTREALGEVPGMAEMFVGTIYAFCLELLKSESPKYLKYEVLNEVQQTLFVDRHSRASGLTQSTTLSGQTLKRYTDTRNFISAMNILREDRPVSPDRLKGNSVAAQLSRYEHLLHDRGYLDYSGILREAVAELKSNIGLRERLAARIRYAIVDEYQDVKPVQETVVEELHQPGVGICVVGDDDQTIYQWRGSDVRNILNFENRYPGVTQVRLEENFRSSEGVVAVAREFIRQVLRRLPKEMKTTRAQDYEPGDCSPCNASEGRFWAGRSRLYSSYRRDWRVVQTPESRAPTAYRYKAVDAAVLWIGSVVASLLANLRGHKTKARRSRQPGTFMRSGRVGSPMVFEADCRTPEQMRLANAYCRYLEAQRPTLRSSARAPSPVRLRMRRNRRRWLERSDRCGGNPRGYAATQH